MKKAKRRESKSPPPKPVQAPWTLRPWHLALAAIAAIVVALEVYGPALNGPFVFDDEYLPFALADFDLKTIFEMIQAIRPALMVNFWLNYHLSGMNPYSYHLFNVLMHLGSAFLVFSIARRLLGRFEADEQRRAILSGFAAGLFLLHPLQTESVAYIASRSESLSVLLAYGALAVFLGQGERGITWLRSAAILVLFGLACLTKEHVAVLPLVLVLTDYYWHPGFSFSGLKRNWRLYVPMTAGAIAGGAFVLNVLRRADTAGFGLKDLPWYEYFYTQWRAIWVYLRMFLIPYDQNVDHEFLISHTPWEHGAIVCLVALLGLAAVAFLLRRKYPLASYGILVFFILIAPTSSVVPIRDTLVERRFYLPSIGILLALVDLFRLWPAKKSVLATATAAVLVVFSLMTWDRNHVWGSSEALWRDAASKAPNKGRAHSQLALAIYNQGRCADSLPEFEKAIRLDPGEYRALINYGLALDCVNRPDDALRAFQQAAAARPAGYPYALMGMIYGKQGRRLESMQAIEKSIKIEPNNDLAYLYRGNLYMVSKEFDKAMADYQWALKLNPRNELARAAVTRLQQSPPRAQ